MSEVRKQARLPRLDREQQLLSVAMTIFVARGYQGSTVEDIAFAAGVTRPIVYKHYGSKDQIYLACLRYARTLLDASLLTQAFKNDSLSARLLAAAEGYFAFVETHQTPWRLLYESGTAVAGMASEENKRLRAKTVEQVFQLLREVAVNVSDLELMIRANAISGAGEQLAKWWVMHPDVSKEQVVSALYDFSWAGLSKFSPPCLP